MARPRYHVATVSGDIVPREGGTAHPVGLSVHVIDRLNAHKVVATFRSETRFSSGYTLGQDGARAAAEALAAELNEVERCDQPASA